MTKENFEDVLAHIATRAQQLAQVALKRELSIYTLTVLPPSNAEYEVVREVVDGCGPQLPRSSASSLYVSPSNLSVCGNTIAFLGVREPHMGQFAVGYADFPVDAATYDAIQAEANPNVRRDIGVSGQGPLRVSHDDFLDVFGFVVSNGE